MTAPQDREAANAPATVIGGKWGLSIAVVIALIGAAVANVRMMAVNSDRTTTLEAKIDVQGDTLKEVKVGITSLTGTMQRELSTLQREAGDIRERLARETGELRVQIAELRAEVRRSEQQPR
jgi:hypothetical protein